MAVDLEGLEFQIEAQSDGATKHLESLTSALKSVKEQLKSFAGVTKVVTGLTKLGEAARSVSEEDVSRLSRLATALSSIKNVGEIKISATLPTRISEIGAAARSMSDADIDRLERFSNALSGLSSFNGRINIRMNPVMNDGTQTENALDVTPQVDMGDAKEEIDDTISRASSLRDTLASIGSSIGGGIRNFLGDLRLLASSATQSSAALRGLMRYTVLLPITLGSSFAAKVRQTTTSLGHMFGAIKRIALYRLIRSVIKEITQGLQEGIKNIYAYSNALNGEFASAMDSLATSSLYLKNSIGALAAPIIQALVPAINFAIDRIVTLMNMINMLVSALGGKATFTAAKKMETSFADAANGAAGAAKGAVDKIKSYTIGIDELNILDDSANKGAGGGGGGGAAGLNTADMFEEVDIDSAVSDFANRLREAFQKGQWAEVGTILGEEFNNIVQHKIPWDDLGNKIGSKLGAAITIASNALGTANTLELGVKFGGFFNNAIEMVPTDELGRLLTRCLTKPIDAVLGFTLTVKEHMLAGKVNDFFHGAFSEATDWLGGHEWYDIGSQLRTKITNFLKDIDWSGIRDDLLKFIKTLNLSFLEFFSALLGIDPQKFQNQVIGFFENLFNGGGNVVETPDGPQHRQTVIKGGLFGGERTVKYTPLTNYELNGYNDEFSTAFKNPKATVEFTAELKDDSLKWRSSLDTNWNKVNQNPVSPFATGLQNDGSIWNKDRNIWWDEYNGMPVSAFRTNLADTSFTWFTDRNRYWDSKNDTPVSPIHTVMADDSSIWKVTVEKAWNAAKPTLTANTAVNVSGSAMWSAVEKAWNAASKTLTAKVNVSAPNLEWKTVKMPTGLEVPMWTQNGTKTFWGAKGGILDGAQLIGRTGNTFIGAGEAGREALLPLDQNTGWMDIIAEKVHDTMKSAETSNTSDTRLLGKLDEILDRLDTIEDDTRRQADKPSNTYVSVGGKDVRDAVVEQGRADGYSFR